MTEATARGMAVRQGQVKFMVELMVLKQCLSNSNSCRISTNLQHTMVKRACLAVTVLQASAVGSTSTVLMERLQEMQAIG